MYIAKIPNRNSPPAYLLRESFRQDGKVKNRTLANLSHLPRGQIEAIRRVLKGQTLVPVEEAFSILRSLPHGHVAAVLGTLRRLGLESLIDRTGTRQRRLVVAMIVARLLRPGSKLATARALDRASRTSTLGALLQLEAVGQEELYAAMDWLLERQGKIERALARRHLSEGTLVLYDLSSSYYTGRCCPLARHGHSRDGKRGFPQIVYGLLCNGEGCPVAIEVFEGNTADANTLAVQVAKLRQRFGLQRVVIVGDRGVLTSARLREELVGKEGLDWITALRAGSIRKLVEQGAIQMSLFDQHDLAEITSPDYPGERLVVCRNPLLADERARKREELLQATQRQLEKIVQAVQRARRPLRGKERIALWVGRVINRYKMAKHFVLEIEDDHFSYRRDEAKIAEEAALDGLYVLRTSVEAKQLGAEQAVLCYKRLSRVEWAFRSLKTVDLKIRPIHHRLTRRVKAHVFLCMLAYYVQWHMRQKLAPLLFDEDDRQAAAAARRSPVAPAARSASARRKAAEKTTPDHLPVHSFQGLLDELATLTCNEVCLSPRAEGRPEVAEAGACQPGQGASSVDRPESEPFLMQSQPTAIQARVFALLGFSP